MGCEVALAAHGREAITLYAEAIRDGTPFDLVLLDLNVSFGLGAVETLEALRSLESTVKAVVMSGYSDSDVIRNFTRHGFHGGLSKPFSLRLLRAVVTQALTN
jgi:CheY-like chemotaxis protein